MTRRTWLAFLFAICWLGATPVSLRAEASNEQIWLISTREAGCCCGQPTGCAPIDFWRLDCTTNTWQCADGEAFRASDDPSVPTTVLVHGNRVDPCRAVKMGWDVYWQLKCSAAGRPFRLVIWSWPSERIHGPLRDVRAKACRSDCESFYLATVLDRMNPEVRVNLVGFSFGCRTITGALELLAGGQINGMGMARETVAARKPMRAVLIAAASDAQWLLPGQRNGLALNMVDQMLITVNCQDPVLKRYQLMYGLHGGPRALGWCGPACPSYLGWQAQKIGLIDCSWSVGRVHSWEAYFPAVGGWIWTEG